MMTAFPIEFGEVKVKVDSMASDLSKCIEALYRNNESLAELKSLVIDGTHKTYAHLACREDMMSPTKDGSRHDVTDSIRGTAMQVRTLSDQFHQQARVTSKNPENKEMISTEKKKRYTQPLRRSAIGNYQPQDVDQQHAS